VLTASSPGWASCLIPCGVALSRSLKLKGGVHTLRHSAATRWLNRGIDLQSVRVMLGHLHITSIAIYLGVALDKLVRKYQLCLEGAPGGGDPR
jgi:site-specific recombinase XerD